MSSVTTVEVEAIPPSTEGVPSTGQLCETCTPLVSTLNEQRPGTPSRDSTLLSGVEPYADSDRVFENLSTRIPQSKFHRFVTTCLVINASFVQGTFVIISGRIGSVYGHKNIVVLGGAWFTICSLANGFTGQSYAAFIIMRALTGIGGALIMPNAVSIITTTLPPGKARNLSLALFGGAPALGGGVGGLLAGAFVEFEGGKRWLFVTVLLAYMSFGIFLWYMVSWQELVRHWSALHLTVGLIPFCISAAIGTGLAAFLIPRIAAQYIIAIGVISVLISNILLATMPREQTYWAQVFPAVISVSLCPDFVYTAAQIIASNSVRRKDQGIAGSLIGTLNLYGGSLGLGFAGTVESRINHTHQSHAPLLGYRAALAFGAGISAIALFIDLFFVRMPKDEREGWEDEEDRESAGIALVTATGTSREDAERGVAVSRGAGALN
ncbi:MAG: hypothetical protein Q9227_004615 [Pyrenula ochraceoflavens]